MAAHSTLANFDPTNVDTSRYESVNGRLLERPLPNERHAELQKNILLRLDAPCRALGMKVLPEWTVDKSADAAHDWLTPDVTVSLPDSPRSKAGNLLPPFFLAVEVLSPSQSMTEMIRKAKHYLDWGVQYVWLIDPSGIALALAAHTNQASWSDENGAIEAGPLRLLMSEIL